MQYKEITVKRKKFVGIGVDTSVQNAGQDCPKVWSEFLRKYKEIKNYIGGMKNYGFSKEISKQDCEFRYTASAEVSEFENIPEEMEKIEITETKFLVFTHKGKLGNLNNTYWKIMKFMPISGHKQKDFWIEFYDSRWKGDKDESEFEIWVAIE